MSPLNNQLIINILETMQFRENSDQNTKIIWLPNFLIDQQILPFNQPPSAE